ncbi:MAG: acyl carrier protein [Methylococcaceae bacterium]|nr:acyl carrier protein [Methylococcaceae bacterium]
MSETMINQLKDIIVSELDVNLKHEDISEEVSLFEEGIGLDSVTIMEFISLIEARFSIQFTDEELDFKQFNDLKTLAGFVSNKVAA